MPNTGDTNFVLTKRPISPADTFYFTTNRSYIIADVVKEDILPEKFELFQNYPNPFNPITTIRFAIQTPPSSSPLVKGRNEVGLVTLKVFDILAREIATLAKEALNPGTYSILFNTQQYRMASGVYFYSLEAGEFSQTKKMILLK
jgi:hypothetical protein